MTTLESRLWDRLCQLTNDGATPLVKDQFLEMVRTEVSAEKPKPVHAGVDVGLESSQTNLWISNDGVFYSSPFEAAQREAERKANYERYARQYEESVQRTMRQNTLNSGIGLLFNT